MPGIDGLKINTALPSQTAIQLTKLFDEEQQLCLNKCKEYIEEAKKKGKDFKKNIKDDVVIKNYAE